MKHTKRILIPIMLILTLLCMLISVSAADEITVKNPAAKLTVTSVTTGETVETLYEIAEGAFYAAEQDAQSTDKTVTVTMLAPATRFTFECAIAWASSPITVDLGGFHHYIKCLNIAGECTLTVKNGTLTTCGAYASSPYGIQIVNPDATVILEKDVTVIGADRNNVIHAEGVADVILARNGTTPVYLKTGTLVNYGTIIGGTSATAVQNDGGEIYNHGTIAGGDGNASNPHTTFESGCGVNGYHGVMLNTGIIRSGNAVCTEPTDAWITCGPAVYGIVHQNTGTIIGGSATANSPIVSAGPGVYGAVGLNTGTIRGGDAHSSAEQGSVYAAEGVIGWQKLNATSYGYAVDSAIEAVVLDNRGTITTGKVTADSENVTVTYASAVVPRGLNIYEVLYNSGEITALGGANAIDEMIPGCIVYENTGTISPIAFEQTDLTVSIDGKPLTSDTPYPFYDGKERTVTYSMTFGGKEVTFEGITSALTLDGKEVSVLLEAGKYTLTVTHGEESKTYPLMIRPAHPFIDIADDHPYYTDIAGVYQKSLMNGIEPNVFSPDTPLSRAMLVTMLWRMEGCPVVNYLMRFSDVPQGEWYSEAIRWAAAEKLVLGYDDGSFGINDPITLDQMSVILYRYEQYKGGGFKGLWMFHLNYDDIADISDWAYESVCYMVMKNIYCTPSETTLQPQRAATRAEAAAFLNRYAEMRAASALPTE